MSRSLSVLFAVTLLNQKHCRSTVEDAHRFSTNLAWIIFLGASTLFWLAAPSALRAQTILDLGMQAYHVYQSGQIDNVNLDNGSLNVAIPLVSYPQRGSQLSMSFELVFSGSGSHGLTTSEVASLPGASQRVRSTTTKWSTGRAMTSGGEPLSLLPGAFSGTVALVDTQDLSEFTNPLRYITQARVTIDCPYAICSSPEVIYLGGATTQVIWNSADGSQHPAGQMAAGQIALDGSGYQNGMTYAESQTNLYGTPTCHWLCGEPGFIAVKDGVSYFSNGNGPTTANGPILREDADGNYITRSSTQYVDTTGRVIPLPTLISNPTSQEIASCGGPLPITQIATWTPPGYSEPFLFCFVNITISLPYAKTFTPGSSYFHVGTYTATELQNVVLPNQQKWTFQYNESHSLYSSTGPNGQVVASGLNFGDLTQITFPTGGTLNYQWTMNEQEEYPPEGSETTFLQSRTLNANDGTGAHLWTYNIQSCTGRGTCTSSVTDPAGNVTSQKLTFGSAASGSNATRTIVTTSNTGHVFKTVTKTYPYQYATWNGFPLYPTSEQTTLDNGKSTLTTRTICCDISFLYSLSNTLDYTQGLFPWAASNGKVTDEKIYDYSTGTGALLRDTQTSYEFQSSKSYYNPSGENPGFFNLPSQKTIYDGSGSVVAQSNYYYDAGSRTPSGITTQFDAALFPVGGHLTSETDWLNTGGTSPTFSNTYYDTGELYKATDPRGATTTYQYSSTYGGALPTTTTNAMGQQSVSNYVPETGMLQSMMDPNGQTTTYAYNDPMARLTGVSQPDGGSTSYQYNDTGTLGLTVTQAISSGVSSVIQSNVDGIGRLYETKLISDPEGTINTRTSYDALGRTYQVWNPTRCDPMTNSSCSGESTWGISTTKYDALGRITSQVDADQVGTKSWTYNGNQTTFTDENGNNWVHTTDALGRLTKVLEPNGSGQAASMESDYTYDALNNLLTVKQYGGPTSSPDSDGPVSRSYSYDSLSRLLSATNPESGTVSYTYDRNGNVLTKTSPAMNGASGSQIVGYCYDMLNNLVGKWNGAPPSGCSATPTTITSSLLATYTFGNTANSNRSVGRLTDEKSYLNGSLITERSPTEYDLMGRLVYETQTPYSPSGASYQFFYGYNLAGDLTCANNGFATVTDSSTCANLTGQSSLINELYTYDQANRLIQVNAGAQPTSFASLSSLFLASSTSPASYDPLGNMVNGKLATNQSSELPAITIARNLDSRGNLLSELDQRSDSSVVYSYVSPAANGHDAAGNLKTYSDSVVGSWNLSYDTLNRLSAAQVSAVTSFTQPYANAYGCWSYDGFGNRTKEALSTQTTTPCASGVNDNLQLTVTNVVQGKNQLANVAYDAAGNAISDGYNSYRYDAEGRLCAVAYPNGSGGSYYEQYLYDADGRRVAKAPTSSLNCGVPPAPTNEYLLGPNGEQVTELSISGSMATPLHSNVFAGGKLLATYDFAHGGLHFALSDPLGTKRVQITSAGVTELNCVSLPFGNNLGNTRESNCTAVGNGGTDSTEQHFTGKERDAESGNDYFGARYYASAMGRWISPDSGADAVVGVPVPFAELENPQSLNLYAYAGNNPLKHTDPDGQNYYVCVDNGYGGRNCKDLTDDQYADLLQQQNGKQGINMPGFPGGHITCGGQNCGTATYHELGMKDTSGDLLMLAIPIERLAGPALGVIGKAIGGLFGKGSVDAAVNAGAKVLLNGGSKQEAKVVIEGLAEGAQKAAAKRELARTTTKEAVSISKAADGTVTITRTRPGWDGSQTFTKTIDATGNTSSVQTAHDAAGNLVHYDPKN